MQLVLNDCPPAPSPISEIAQQFGIASPRETTFWPQKRSLTTQGPLYVYGVASNNSYRMTVWNMLNWRPLMIESSYLLECQGRSPPSWLWDWTSDWASGLLSRSLGHTCNETHPVFGKKKKNTKIYFKLKKKPNIFYLKLLTGYGMIMQFLFVTPPCLMKCLPTIRLYRHYICS